MKFILAGLGNWYSGWELIKSAVPESESLGYWGAIMPDHYMWGPTSGGDSTVDTWVVLTYLAARTERIRLGTLVTPIPLRPPAVLAKMVSTLDLISHGRVLFGVGAGWSQTEFEGYSQWNNAKVRVDQTVEGLELILKLWTEQNPVNFHGHYYTAENAVLDPKPVQKPHPPLLFGGVKPRMLRMAGRNADICFIPPWAEMSYMDAKAVVVREAQRAGRENKISFAGGVPSQQSFRMNYDVQLYENKVEDALKYGCEYFVVPFPRENYLDCMRDFAKNVIASFAN